MGIDGSRLLVSFSAPSRSSIMMEVTAPAVATLSIWVPRSLMTCTIRVRISVLTTTKMLTTTVGTVAVIGRSGIGNGPLVRAVMAVLSVVQSVPRFTNEGKYCWYATDYSLPYGNWRGFTCAGGHGCAQCGPCVPSWRILFTHTSIALVLIVT